MGENKEINNLRDVLKIMEEYNLKYIKFKNSNFECELKKEAVSH